MRIGTPLTDDPIRNSRSSGPAACLAIDSSTAAGSVAPATGCRSRPAAAHPAIHRIATVIARDAGGKSSPPRELELVADAALFAPRAGAQPRRALVLLGEHQP